MDIQPGNLIKVRLINKDYIYIISCYYSLKYETIMYDGYILNTNKILKQIMNSRLEKYYIKHISNNFYKTYKALYEQ